jgi:hypothetical protein
MVYASTARSLPCLATDKYLAIFLFCISSALFPLPQLIMSMLNPKHFIQSPLPPLREGSNRTRSSALKPLEFLGRLTPWPDFETAVWNTYISETWRTPTLTHRPKSGYERFNLVHEHILVGDEHGVQERMKQNVGQVMNSIFAAQGMNIAFSDFKCASTNYRRIQDMAVIDVSGQPLLVGEIKSPWIDAHNMNDFRGESAYKHVFGQIADYMYDQQLMYGFLSTYEYTIFLKQVRVNNQWQLQFSDPIPFDAVSSPQNGTVSVRQCFFHICHEAIRQ